MALLAQSPLLLPGGWDTQLQMALRWVHLLAGLTWIGLLYFFNLVSFPALPRLDPPARSQVVTSLLPTALGWFRWGAAVTVAAGSLYWILILAAEHAPPARTFLIWSSLIAAAFAIQALLLRVPTLTKNTCVFVILVLVVVGLQGHFIVQWIAFEGASNRTISIAVGGGIGVFLLLNVWEIVWPAQKQLIAWTAEHPGEPAPAELAKKVRQAYLVSRASFWLTLPLLFFMATASHFPLFAAGE